MRKSFVFLISMALGLLCPSMLIASEEGTTISKLGPQVKQGFAPECWMNTGLIATDTDMADITHTDTKIINVTSEGQMAYIVEKSTTDGNVNYYKDYTISIDDDLDFSSSKWKSYTPKNNSSYGFSGTIEGNGHSISNLTIPDISDATYATYSAFVPFLVGGTIKDLVFESTCSVASHANYVGMVVAYNSDGTITNVTNKGSVTIFDSADGGCQHGGGIVGGCDESGNNYFNNCVSSGTFSISSSTKEGSAFGGICGQLARGYIANSSCSSTIEISDGLTHGSIGGILGFGGNFQYGELCCVINSVTLVTLVDSSTSNEGIGTVCGLLNSGNGRCQVINCLSSTNYSNRSKLVGGDVTFSDLETGSHQFSDGLYFVDGGRSLYFYGSSFLFADGVGEIDSEYTDGYTYLTQNVLRYNCDKLNKWSSTGYPTVTWTHVTASYDSSTYTVSLGGLGDQTATYQWCNGSNLSIKNNMAFFSASYDETTDTYSANTGSQSISLGFYSDENSPSAKSVALCQFTDGNANTNVDIESDYENNYVTFTGQSKGTSYAYLRDPAVSNTNIDYATSPYAISAEDTVDTNLTIKFKISFYSLNSLSGETAATLSEAHRTTTSIVNGVLITLSSGCEIFVPTSLDYFSKKVTFDSNGGAAVTPQTLAIGDKVSEPTSVSKDHYSFAGWYKDAALTTAWDFATDTIADNMTLYAKWSIDTFAITYDSNGGSSVTNGTADYGGLITAPTAPSKTGYTFAGWYKDSALTTAWNFASDVITSATTLYAKWTPIPYTVTFNSNGGSSVSPATVNYGEKVTRPTDPTYDLYTFGGWYKNVGLTVAWNFDTDCVYESVTIYAKWTPFATISNENKDETNKDFTALIKSPVDGYYKYAVVDKDGEVPTTYSDTTKQDITAGDNNITISNLPYGEKTIYIQVTDKSNNPISVFHYDINFVETTSSSSESTSTSNSSSSETPSSSGTSYLWILWMCLGIFFFLIGLYYLLYELWYRKDKKPLSFLVKSFRKVDKHFHDTDRNLVEQKQDEEDKTKKQ